MRPFARRTVSILTARCAARRARTWPPAPETVEEGDAAEETDPAQNPAEQTILSWEWIGADNLNEGVLPLPGVSAENPVDLDAVVSMLPTGITATVGGSEEPVELTITWGL